MTYWHDYAVAQLWMVATVLSLLCASFLVRPLAGKAGQRPYQKKVLWGRLRRPHTNRTLTKQI
jgi:hypothetical protein